MKKFLSRESIAMLEQEAGAQRITLDQAVLREPLFADGAPTVEFRNVRIEDASARVEVKYPSGLWTTVHFLFEDGAWKIDKQGFADALLRESEQQRRKLDSMIEQGR